MHRKCLEFGGLKNIYIWNMWLMFTAQTVSKTLVLGWQHWRLTVLQFRLIIVAPNTHKNPSERNLLDIWSVPRWLKEGAAAFCVISFSFPQALLGRQVNATAGVCSVLSAHTNNTSKIQVLSQQDPAHLWVFAAEFRSSY